MNEKPKEEKPQDWAGIDGHAGYWDHEKGCWCVLDKAAIAKLWPAKKAASK